MSIKITTLVENSVYGKGLQGEHGLSLLVDTGEHRLLFDTGASDLFIRNARILGIDLKEVDFLVLSHGHRDHTGGLHPCRRGRAGGTAALRHCGHRGERCARAALYRRNPRDMGSLRRVRCPGPVRHSRTAHARCTAGTGLRQGACCRMRRRTGGDADRKNAGNADRRLGAGRCPRRRLGRLCPAEPGASGGVPRRAAQPERPPFD